MAFTSFQGELWLANEALPQAHPGLTSGSRYLISGMPDPHRLRTALQTLYAHVPLLGATLRLDDGKVMPEIDLHAELAPDFEYVDLSSAPDPQAACDAFEMRFREQRYDLFGGSLMQVRLLRLGASRACLLMRAFHAIADGLTLIAHFETLLHIYNALAEGRSPALGEPCDWPAVVAADQAWQVSAQAARDRTFWVEHLRALPDERLFVPRPGLPDRLDETGLSQIDLSAAAIADLEALEARHRCSAGMLLLALHALVLGRVFDHERVCVQMPLSLGERKDLHRAQGYRVAVVPLNVDLRGEQTLATLLQALRRQSVSLMRHARTPYQRAAREAGLHLPPGLADTNINYLPVVPGGDGQDFLLSDFGSLVSRHEPVILGVYAVESRIQGRRGLKLTVVHRRTYFDVEDVRRHVRRIEALLAAFRADDGLLLHAAPCLLPEEQAQLEGWEEGASLDFVQGTIWQLFERQALASADAPAVVAPDGSRQDYRTLRARALGVADWVRRAGVMPGQVVAVLARRDPALPAILLGILRAGAVYLPVDPDYPPERIRHMLSDSGARSLLALHADDLRLAPEGLAGLSAECLPAHLPGPESPGGASSGVASLSEDGGDALPEVTPEAPAYLIYTSGSTGQPKGVLVPHAGFVNMIQGQAHLLGLRPGVRVLQFASPSFDASLSEIFMALTTGGTLYPVTREMIDAPWALRDYLSRNGIAVVTWPPSYLALFGREPLPGVRVLITAGEAPIGEDVRHYAAEKVYVNAYGPTETSVCATLTRLHPVLADGQPHSIGRPLPNTSCHVLDRHGRRLPPGMSGELYLGGAGVGIGYLNRPQLSAERFVRLATLGGRRVYRTGDRACWTENGELMLIGRMDEQVKLRGHRVELGEIVAVLERHPAVSQAAVLVNRSQRGGVWLLAFVAGAPVAELQAGALADWLRGRLPEYMLPNRYYRLDALPVSPAGKVDKAALLRLDEQALASTTGPARPAGGLEQGGTSTGGVDAHALAQLCAHYEAVLGRPVSDSAADFMALGGDSLQAMVLARRLSQAYRQPVAVRDLLAGGAPLSVCRRLQPPGTAGTAPREDGQGVAASGTQQPTAPALTQGQFQLWVLDCLQAAEARYNMPLAVTLQGDAARVRDFMSALIASIEAQPACRSRFVGDIDAPRMDILPASGVHAEWLDLRTADDAQARLVALIDERVHRPFRLSEAPLLRLSVFRLGAQAWCVLLVMHHIIGDADSLALLLAEAARRCADEDDDVGTARAPDPVSDPALRAAALAQFAADERLYLESTARRDDLAYWQRCLLPLPARLDLVPGQGSRSAARGQGGMVRCALPDGMAAKLQTLASHSGTTLLGAFIGLTCDWLHRRSGQDDLCVALPIGLRDTPELQHTVGYCVNTVLLRSRQASAAGMERVRLLGEQLRAALAHGRHPFSLLPAALGETRDPARGPLVDVMLTLIDQAALLDGLDRAGTGLRFGLHDVALRAAKFDYTFMLVSGVEGCLSLALEHDLSVCTHEQAGALLDALA
ncbi:MAG: amino acid adenylation domain-containing protein, partial [Rhodocyclaceae bacterium]|nr:amino acid adenylation domain-containing protein [Rhodocyclaceae bacterium]